ncbi:Dolichyl-phosphate beta-glucosyltransferase [Seminavis robusta]|uniref:Dolichyl-phosphate beta-glucosyltransferase n=1 Tax=Seminavis robusta TaxID=568900 RepID=A0A9N8DUK2_9STRA|nr:Dolichyl-phosphate beta-glucosyltransferase [Seminavis robusta]|eukprot:Sro287_g108560.1 Dolichyl-phosphate beta-glucosyltransferase (233) ;mRNA; r:29669-30367
MAESLHSQVSKNDRDTHVKIPVDCISLECNQGKGAALAMGIRHISAQTSSTTDIYNSLVLIADADASADITCLDDLYKALQKLTMQPSSPDVQFTVPALVVGRRIYNDDSQVSPSRVILRWGFRTAVRILCGDLGVSDTQCGFKLMTLSAAEKLYHELNLQGWSHDVEVLLRAKLCRFLVTEHNVRWQDKEGSKLVTSAGGTVGASLQMLWEIAQLRLSYSLGIWNFSYDSD